MTVTDDLRHQLRPGSTALLVIDVQNDFVHPEGWGKPSGEELSRLGAVIVQINRLIDSARKAGTQVVYVRVEHGPEVDGAPYRARYARRGMTASATICHAGSWGAQLSEDLLPPRPGEPEFVKHGYDAFSVAELGQLLARRDVTSVVVTGVVANLCVRATVFSAFEHGYFPFVPREATASTDPAVFEQTLADIEAWYGEVVAVDDVIEAWAGAPVR